MNPNEILVKATKLLIQLDTNPAYKNELLAKAPPVLWFGNSQSNKPKIVTIGANPSRSEFLDKNFKKDSPKKKSEYEKKYLPHKRFYHLSENESYESIIKSKILQDKITSSYNHYFYQNPYTKWFGSNKDTSYSVEGVLRGMGASYYDNDSKYSAIHIDLFPYPTISDYTKIKSPIDTDILKQPTNQEVFQSILEFLNPKFILIFGITNLKTFAKLYSIDLSNPTKFTNKKASCNLWKISYQNWKGIGLSVNLGNPRGFDACWSKRTRKESFK
jgi:hypothetical protein